MHEPHLSGLVADATRRLHDELGRLAPMMAGPLLAWMRELAGSDAPGDYFLHPVAFPMLSLPWWAEASLGGEPDRAFQADLIYSTINGYYHIRMIDNVMDGDATVEPLLLPALGFFHMGFQGAYQRHFAYPHPFWALFEQVWAASAEATVRDRRLTAITLEQFAAITARKLCAAAIPVAAVCHRYGRPELIAPWSALIDGLGRWHQFWNDAFTWRRDVAGGVATYFLAEAERRRRPAEPLGGWIVREGFEWAVATLAEWMRDLQATAAALNSPPLSAYLARRAALVREQYESARAGLRSASRLLAMAETAADDHPTFRPIGEGI